MPFLPVILWSDVLIWLLVAAGSRLACCRRAIRCWRRLAAGRSQPGGDGVGDAVARLRCRRPARFAALSPAPGKCGRAAGAARQRSKQPAAYAVEVLSLLDAHPDAAAHAQRERPIPNPWRRVRYAKESIECATPLASCEQTRDYPRLRHGGAHLGDRRGGSRCRRRARVCCVPWRWPFLPGGCWRRRLRPASRAARAGAHKRGLAAHLAQRERLCVERGARRGWRRPAARPAAGDCWPADYHVFGTDKVGQDVLYQVLKSVRTALVIGLVTTLVTLPLSILLGILAGYFRGWVDDLIQYLYTTLSSIPGVLLIAAAVLMMQVVIDTHPQWFATAAERADLRLLALCFILGVTSWTGLCRLLRGETLKLRELEYIQAAQAFGVADLRIIARHILPNLMHIVIIALVMDFSGLVLAEAVLSYVGIGVDPTMISFGTMINNARMELAREPMVWWSLAAAFVFMFALVLAANLLADAVRDAFDPRGRGRHEPRKPA
jgi:peptide/nickel transport system permease protein